MKNEVKDRLKKQLWRWPVFFTAFGSLPYVISYLSRGPQYDGMSHDIILPFLNIRASWNWWWDIPLIFVATFILISCIIWVSWGDEERIREYDSDQMIPRSLLVSIGVFVGVIIGIIVNVFHGDVMFGLIMAVLVISAIAVSSLFLVELEASADLFLSMFLGLIVSSVVMIIIGWPAFLCPFVALAAILIIFPKHGEAKIFYWLNGEQRDDSLVKIPADAIE